ncbi:MAG: O-antigen ligase family protein [Elusimicrobiota bacterium]|nr:O-antigen ligase family protein [Elusimicrobiota bacterium]
MPEKKINIVAPVIAFVVFGIIFAPFFYNAFYIPKMVAAALFLAYLFISGRYRDIQNSPLRKVLLLLIALPLLSLLLSGNTGFIGGNYIGYLVIIFIFAVLSGAPESVKEKQKRYIYSAAIVMLIITALYSILQYYGLPPLSVRFAGAENPIAFMGNRNYVADYLIFLLPFLFAGLEGVLKRDTFKMVELIKYIILSLIVAFALALTRSWRALPALAAIILVYFIFTGKGKLKRFYGILLVFSLVVAAGIFLIRGKTLYGDHLKSRLHRWKITLNMAADRPILGHGIGTFSYLYPEYQRRFFKEDPSRVKNYAPSRLPQRANNEYLQLLAEGGIITFILFAYFFYLLYKKTDLKDRNFNFPVIAGLSGILVSALFGYPFHRPSISLTAAILVAAAVGEGVSGSKISSKSAPGDWKTPAGWVLAVMTLVFVVLKSAEEINMEFARRSFEKGDFISALDKSKTVLAAALVPGKIHFLRGRIFYASGEYKKSLQSYIETQKSYRGAAVFYSCGLVRLRLNDVSGAKEDFRRALMTLPGSVKRYEVLMRIAEYENDEESLKKYRNMLNLVE